MSYVISKTNNEQHKMMNKDSHLDETVMKTSKKSGYPEDKKN